MNKLLIIIPAYNEAASIGQVISSVKKELPQADMLVINDGSTDATSHIARGSGFVVIDLPYNMGIGAAMQTGYRYADLNSYDIAVQVDGDGQHPADQINRLVCAILEQKADMVIGSRFIGKGEYSPSLGRNIGMKVFSMVVSMITGQRITDTTSGFRAANKEVLRFFARNYPEDYPEVEAIVLLHKAGFNIIEIPVRMAGRAGGISSITPFRAVYYMVKVLLAVFIDMLKRVER
ncbi:MAG: glycosyl transferase family 2 [Deltaproteobacteria bacterium GWC2_42_11]|nr:MAG: glycosyl transferase family 2 [Deltaproteobacteria bacterium GWC2_42_11]HBO84298.1 glycosyl transferase family 2 [Deltaproteobacteria bacterium]